MSFSRKVLIPFFLLLLFTVYMMNITLFTHVHYVNGAIITHSHPNNGEHSHSNAEILLIDRLSHVQSVEPGINSLSILKLPVIHILENKKDISFPKLLWQQQAGLRAPPFYTAQV